MNILLCASAIQEPKLSIPLFENSTTIFPSYCQCSHMYYTVNLVSVQQHLTLNNEFSTPELPCALLAVSLRPLKRLCKKTNSSIENSFLCFQQMRTIQISDLDRSESSRFSAALISFILDNAHNISKSRSHSACQMDWTKFKLKRSEGWMSCSFSYIYVKCSWE